MISKREGLMDRRILLELKDPGYKTMQRQAWERCQQLSNPAKVEEWIARSRTEAELIAEAVAERDHNRRMARLSMAAIARKRSPDLDLPRKPAGRETGPSEIRRVK